jgi:arylsulfatase A-like enzyme
MKLPLVLLTLVPATTGVEKAVAAHPERPNILYFYVDDMGWGSIGPNGQAARRAANRPSVHTPNLDRLAAEGVNFTRGYGCHVCSPARSSQQTGFHQGHTFADRNDKNNAKKAMRADDVCMGDALAQAGYVTGYWGKWGYGGSADMAAPVIDNVQTLPTSHGYQYVLAELHHVRAHTFFQPTLWSAPASGKSVGGLELVPNSMAPYQNKAEYPNTPALQNHARYPNTAYCDDAYAMAALEFVRKQAANYHKTGQPFFGLLATQIPHAPFGEIATLPEWDKAYAKDKRFKSVALEAKQWAAMVTRIDTHFGNILAALEDPNGDGDPSDSVADNTLVVFQSDNGGPPKDRSLALGANGGLRGGKGAIHEGGIRVPLVMRWPTKITQDSKLKAGTNCDMVVDVTDLLPTFCELAGVLPPLGIDGVSIAPTLRSAGHQRIREFVIHEAKNGKSIIRGRHKLVLSNAQGKGQKGRARRQVSSLELYDLEVDASEEHDIANDHPELVKELESLLLGERVTEPQGFANTYHHWTGKDGATTSDADNWSSYQYANAGITYMTDDGAPRLSWIARIENTGNKPNTARADANLEILGLEVRGSATKAAGQSLVLGSDVNLTGRNEIRLAEHAALIVNGGTVASLRWIDIHPNATLEGNGNVDSIVYNSGSITVTGCKEPSIKVSADYHQSCDATLTLPVHGEKEPALQVTGEARLGGTLAITIGTGLTPVAGKAYTILTADRVTGEFLNQGGEVVATDGSRFLVQYSKSAVTITLK